MQKAEGGMQNERKPRLHFVISFFILHSSFCL